MWDGAWQWYSSPMPRCKKDHSIFPQPSSPSTSPSSSPSTSPQGHLPSPPPTWPEDHQLSPRPTLPQVKIWPNGDLQFGYGDPQFLFCSNLKLVSKYLLAAKKFPLINNLQSEN